MANLTAPMPSSATPFLKDGLINEPWYRYLFQLQLRTGGAGQIPDINALQAQADYNTSHVDYQSIQWQDTLTQENTRRINDLAVEMPGMPNLSDIRQRLADLEVLTPDPTDLNAIRRKIEDLEAILADFRMPTQQLVEQWTAPTLINSWVNNGGGFNNAGYYKDPFGIVHLRGVIKSGTMAAAAFILPVGYRPVATELFPTVSNNAFGTLNVDSSGNVIPAVGTNAFVTLDGHTFRAA